MKKRINCDVKTCRYNNEEEEGKCLLNELYISSEGRGNKCMDSSSTICQSFEKTAGLINDNEYEVQSEQEVESDQIMNSKKKRSTI